MSRVLAAMAALAIVASSFAVGSTVALAHERRQVGPYTFVVGWVNEPAYVNSMNALDLAVTETQAGKAVEGLDKTLKAEVIVGGGAKALPLTLAARFGMPGRYQGFVLPTKTGEYVFHISGTAGTTNVDERFESGPGRFGSIESTDALQFPDKLVTTAELAARMDTLQTLAIAGLVLAGLALVLTTGGLVLRRR
jgi:hypothetical protein